MRTTCIQCSLAGALSAWVLSLGPPALLQAATTIDAGNHYAYGANIGWIEGRGDVANGAVIGEYVCAGYVYAANVGWINLGSGSPANGIQYQNNSGTDYGVNQDGLGNLRGYAYGANIGWINFESTGAPKVDLATGKFSGYAWSANCGWISLSNTFAHVQTDAIAAGADTDGDGMADAWERTWFGNLTTANASSDYDHDGVTDPQECLADTSPKDANDHLRFTACTRSGTQSVLWWTSKPTRFYRVEQREAFEPASPWQHRATGFDNQPGWNSVVLDNLGPECFYRIRVVKPLSP